MSTPILEAKQLSKSFPPRDRFLAGPGAPVRAVDGVSCALMAGARLGLVGESGSGKTTLAKLLIGLLAPGAGEVRLKGRPLASLRGRELLSARRAVQFVFQDPLSSLNPRMTVEETLGEPLLIHRLASGAARRARIEELLQMVELSASFRRRLPRELSGGERQRVGIARALATGPEAILCDEPIASLDVSVGAKILELLRRLCRDRRMALLLISHDLRAVASLCEQVAVMKDGRLIETGPTQEILNRPSQSYTELLIRSAELDLDAA